MSFQFMKNIAHIDNDYLFILPKDEKKLNIHSISFKSFKRVTYHRVDSLYFPILFQCC